MPRVLITGANRGIGLEFARQYSSDGWDVVATARESSPELDRLGVEREQLDLSDADSVALFPGRIAGSLDLFIANAGTNCPMETDGADNAREWQTMLMRAGLSESYAKLLVELFTAHNAGRIDAERNVGEVRRGRTELMDALRPILAS